MAEYTWDDGTNFDYQDALVNYNPDQEYNWWGGDTGGDNYDWTQLFDSYNYADPSDMDYADYGYYYYPDNPDQIDNSIANNNWYETFNLDDYYKNYYNPAPETGTSGTDSLFGGNRNTRDIPLSFSYNGLGGAKYTIPDSTNTFGNDDSLDFSGDGGGGDGGGGDGGGDGGGTPNPNSTNFDTFLRNLFGVDAGTNTSTTNYSGLLSALLSGAGSYLSADAQKEAFEKDLALRRDMFDYQKGINEPYLQGGTYALDRLRSLVEQNNPATLNGMATPNFNTNLNQQHVGMGPDFRLNAGTSELQYDPATILANSPDLQAANQKALETIRAQAAAGTNPSVGGYGSGNMMSAEAENLRANNMNYLGQVYNQSLSTNQNNNALRQQALQTYNNYLQQGYSNEVAATLANNDMNSRQTMYGNQMAQQDYTNQWDQQRNLFDAANISRNNLFAPYYQMGNWGLSATGNAGTAAANYAQGAGNTTQLLGSNQGDMYSGLLMALNRGLTGTNTRA